MPDSTTNESQALYFSDWIHTSRTVSLLWALVATIPVCYVSIPTRVPFSVVFPFDGESSTNYWSSFSSLHCAYSWYECGATQPVRWLQAKPQYQSIDICLLAVPRYNGECYGAGHSPSISGQAGFQGCGSRINSFSPGKNVAYWRHYIVYFCLLERMF